VVTDDACTVCTGSAGGGSACWAAGALEQLLIKSNAAKAIKIAITLLIFLTVLNEYGCD